MIDPVTLTKQARAVRAYRIHMDLTGQPPHVADPNADEDRLCFCGCGRELEPGNRNGMHRLCAKREWNAMDRARARAAKKSPGPMMHPCGKCGTPIQKWVNENLHKYCPECRLIHRRTINRKTQEVAA